MGRLVRALRMGVSPQGGKIPPGTVFLHEGALGSWMEEVEPSASPLPPAPSAAPEEGIAHTDTTSEAAPQAPRPTRKRNGG